MRLLWKLTLASMTMLFRQKEAIIWSILLPLLMITLFGFVRFDGVGHLHLGIVNESGGGGARLIGALGNMTMLKVQLGDREVELKELEKGERDMVLVIPPGYDVGNGSSVTLYVSDEKPREEQLGSLIVQRALDEGEFERSPTASRQLVKTRAVKSRNLTYIDFLVPGILSMSIMQMGIFGVAFSFVGLKKRGILRRLWVTPIRPIDFIIAQVATRLILMILQILIIVGVGYVFFNLHLIGSIWQMVLLGAMGAVVFLAMGFAISGVSKSEDQVAPLANAIALPMMLLSGIFFSRTNLPAFAHAITDFFPLTYLADGMRAIAIDGSSLVQVAPQMLGLGVWCVIAVLVAVKLFRWE